MKRIAMLFGCLLLALCLTGCGSNQYVKKISYEEAMEKIEAKESFILEIMSADCSACKDFSPKLDEVTKEYEVTVYQLDISSMSGEDWTSFSDTYSVSSTPTTMFFTEGEEITVATRIDGSVSKDKIISKFKTMGYIKE